MADNTFLCIDLKSFYASVECVARGLDPLQARLVVADPSRGPGALCLAVSPALKALGVRNRCRLFEIPPGISYLTATPHMKSYMDVSASIYGLYLTYFAAEDVYAYSIDECFIDYSPYRAMYKESGVDMARRLMEAVYGKTGICATAGVGTNLFLAKIAMDIVAKHVESHIAFLDESSFRETMWHHRPITDFWNIGRGIARRLEKYGIYDLYGVAHVPETLLYREFGKNAEFLIDHAHGREPATMADIHAYRPRHRSLSNGQVLFEDYGTEDARLLVEEMAEMLIQELLAEDLVAGGASLYIGYSGGHRGAGGSRQFPATDSPGRIRRVFQELFRRKVTPGLPIRTVNLSLQDVRDGRGVPRQMDLFADDRWDEKERRVEKVLGHVQRQFGPTALLKGIDYQPRANRRERSGLIGGHHE